MALKRRTSQLKRLNKRPKHATRFGVKSRRTPARRSRAPRKRARAARKVPATVKKYVRNVLDKRIPDKTFIMHHSIFHNSGVSDADIRPLIGGTGGHVHVQNVGINIGQCVLASAGHPTNAHFDSFWPRRGIRLKSLQIKGSLTLPTDWFQKGTGYNYIKAHIWVFELRKMAKQFGGTADISSDDLFLRRDELNGQGEVQAFKDQWEGASPTGFTGAQIDDNLVWNSRKYRLLAHRRLDLTGGISSLQVSQADGTDIPGSGQSHGCTRPFDMKKNFSINVKHPGYIKIAPHDMALQGNLGPDATNMACEYYPCMAIGYIRDGGVDVLDTMVHADYYVRARVEPPAQLSK